MKTIKKVVIYLISTLSVLAALAYFTGNSHLFLGIYDTYLQGRTKPGVEYTDIFAFREIKNKQAIPFAQKENTNQNYLKSTDSLNTKYGTLAYLVIHNDTIIHEKYFENYTPKTISNSFSMSKSILAVLTGIAVREGYLKLNDPVHKFIPELVDSKDSALQIIHLLQMTSGMNFDEDYGNPLGFMAKAYYGKDLVSLLKGYSLAIKPGTQHEYLGGNNLLLSITLQKVLGKSISEYAEEKLWQKIGAETPARWILDHENGYEKSFTGFFATARDFAKIGKLWMQNGKYNNTQIVDSSYVAQSIVPVGVKDDKKNICDYYGYAWWLTEFKADKVFYMRGILGQYVFCIPSKNLIVVRLGKDRAAMSNGITPDDVAIYLEQAYQFL